MLAARRLSIWRERYELAADGQPVAVWDGRTWRSGGTFDLAGRHYDVRANGWGTRYVMTDEAGLTVAIAERVGRKRWTMEAGGRTHAFQRAGWWRREVLLMTDDRPTGFVRRVSNWRSDVVADLPGLPLPLQVFVLVIVLTSWNAQDSAAAASA